MKTFHYYAGNTFTAFDDEQPNPSELVISQITKQMVLMLIAKHAKGVPPYDFEVPRSLLYESHCWNIPTTLLRISPIDEPECDVSAMSVGYLRMPTFEDGVCIVIHARRCVPVHFSMLEACR